MHVREKLIFRALERDDARSIYQRLFEIVSVHERAHLADVAEYLPIGRRPLSALGFLLEAGFSAASLEQRLELRAELVALASSREPDLVLAHIVGFGTGSPSNAHARGFREILRRFIEHLENHLDEFPELDPERNLLMVRGGVPGPNGALVMVQVNRKQ